MKVLILNGSPRVGGNTTTAVKEMEAVFEAEDIEYETIQVGNKDIRGCIACGKCGQTGKCVFDDIVNEVAEKFEAADGLVVASPVYYASSQYWNSIHGGGAGDAQQDEEGKRTMRVLARNMSFLMKSIALGKEKYGLPEEEDRVFTNFIR